jgi:phospholipid transport system substrate-binding protein
MMPKRLQALPAALLATLVALPALAAPASPRPWLESTVERARKLATTEIKAGSKAETKWREDIKATVDDILDWPELTERALGRHWAARSPEEQTKFAALLREMIEASYQSKLRLAGGKDAKKAPEVVIEWQDEKIEGERATASARVKSGKTTATLGFDLLWRDGRWRVYDVAIDDVSTVRTYRSQFGKIIAKDGFPALVERLTTKTKEIREGKADLSKP